MFITKLSEVNSCINQALGKQTVPLPHFSSAQCCQTGLVDPFSRDMFSVMLALVTPSCSLRLPEELRVIHAVSAALVTHSIQAVDVFTKKLSWCSSSFGKSSSYFQNCTKVNPSTQLKFFSYLVPASFSSSQPLCFIRSTAELIPYLLLQLLPMLLSPWATKICNHTTPKKKLSSTREMLLFRQRRARGAVNNRYFRSQS